MRDSSSHKFVLETIESLALSCPQLSEERQIELKIIRDQLANSGA